MPLQKLQFRPGINREGTNYSNEGGWFECDKIRFRSGFPEKLGGWSQATPGNSYQGVCRAMVNWVDLDGFNLLGVGTHLKYYVNSSLGVYHDITPLRSEALALSNPFTTVDGSRTVTVTDAANGAGLGDFVSFTGATGFNGVSADVWNGEFQITKIISSSVYEIELPAGVTPNADGAGGGTVNAYYQLSVGLAAYVVGNGYGAGFWNGCNLGAFNTTLTYTSGTTPWVLLDAISTTVNVTDTSQFPASGTLLIDGELISYSGKTINSFTGCTRGVIIDYTPGSSVLTSTISASDTTIAVADISSFPIPTDGSYGIVRIDNEVISYTGVSTNNLTGCLRGTNGTTAAIHSVGSTVAEYFGVSHSYRPTSGTPEPVYAYSVIGYLGSTGWGDATVGSGIGVGQQMRIWSNDNYGEDLIFCTRGGQIYYWGNNTSTWPRAEALVTDVPITGASQVLVSDVSRFVIAMGCNQFGDTTFDPMIVRWSDQENPNVWTPGPTTQSGDQRLSNGSYIMQAKKNRQEIIIWTDSAIYSMQYIGPPYVWGFQLLMDNISIMGPNAAIVVNNVAYWMGTDKFYSYSGVVQTLPCALRQYVFDDISYDQRYQTVAGTNEGYNEVWWFYVSQTEVNAAVSESRTPMIDRYVVYNHLERIWYYGSLRRTFWLDSGLQQYPMSAQCFIPSGGANEDKNHIDTAQGTLLFQESGVDDASTSTPVPFNAYVSSSDFDIGDGHNFGYVWRIIPDVNFTGSTGGATGGYPEVYMQIKPRDFSGSAYSKSVDTNIDSAQLYTPSVKQYIVQEYTPQVYTRVRGRQMSFKISSYGKLGVAWQLGSPRIDIKPDGKR